MKRLILILCLGVFSPICPTRKVSDSTLATIYHQEGRTIICQSDLKADLTERVPTLRDAIVRELTILDGKKLKIPVTDDEVERALARVQEHLKLDRDELTAFFKKQGFSISEAMKELEKTIMLEKVVDTRIKTKAHVPEKTLLQYHTEHPDIRYHLNQAFIPFEGGSKALVREVVNREIASGEINTSSQWLDIGEVPDKDIAAEKSFIKELPVGSVAISNETQEGITLIRLMGKEKNFKDRKQEIAARLGQERLMQAQQAYYDKLLSEATIHYHTPQS